MIVCQITDFCILRRHDNCRVFSDEFSGSVVDEDSRLAGCGNDLFYPLPVAVVEIFADRCDRISACIKRFDLYLLVLRIVIKPSHCKHSSSGIGFKTGTTGFKIETDIRFQTQ